MNIYGINADFKKIATIRNRFIFIIIIQVCGFDNGTGYFRILISYYNGKTDLFSNYYSSFKN